MGKKGESTRLKRKPAPKIWPIHRKEYTWVVKPKPGPHPILECLPLTLLIRDVLGLAKTHKEAKLIVSQGKIIVDNKVRKDDLFPTGLMDVISVPEIGVSYRLLPTEKGLIPHQLKNKEEAFKLCRIEEKLTLKNGHQQIHLHDGTNLLFKTTQGADNKEVKEFKKFDTLKISLLDKSVLTHIKMVEGATAIVVGGKNRGKHGTIAEIEKRTGKKRPNLLVTLKDKNGNIFKTTMNFVFLIGETLPAISLPEGV